MDDATVPEVSVREDPTGAGAETVLLQAEDTGPGDGAHLPKGAASGAPASKKREGADASQGKRHTMRTTSRCEPARI